MRILFITSNRIGDAVLTTGVLNHLHQENPQARFTIACGPLPATLFRALPNLETLHIITKKKRYGHWIALWRLCVLTRWDLIVDLRDSAFTRLMFAKKKLYKLAHSTGRHKVEDHGSVLGLNPPPSPCLWFDAACRQAAEKLIPNKGCALALGPSANWAVKQWPAERFAELALKLTAKNGPLEGAPILLLAAEHERHQLAPLYEKLPAAQIIDLVGQDLLTAAACLERARLFVGNDSGLMHIAAATQTPTVALFGPTQETIYGPWGSKTAIVRKQSIDTLLARLPHPNARHPNLMEEIEVSDVYEAAKALLE